MTDQSQSAAQSNTHKIRYTAFLLAATLIVIAVLAVAFSIQNDTQPKSTPVVENIIDGNITVNACSYLYYNFSIPLGASTSKVQGTFTVSDGSSNDIKVYVMDSENFANWQKGLSASRYYDSGQAETGNVKAKINSNGTCYLVYDNTYSSISKNVTTQVDFDYL